MHNIKSIIIIFLLGAVVGFCVSEIYLFKKQREAEQEAADLVDFVISEWTGVRDDESVDDSDSLSFNAQFPARKELPAARLGFFPDTVRSLAEMVQKRYNVPAAVTLAQWALESGFGKNNLGVSNYFGHTFGATGKHSELKQWVSRTETMLYKRTLRFTVYKNIGECFDAHGKYLSTSKLYRAAFYTNTPENFARVLAMHYAEDPEYAAKIITIIRRYKL